jgi:hypothetical protein
LVALLSLERSESHYLKIIVETEHKDLQGLPPSYVCLLPGGVENSEPRTHGSCNFPKAPSSYSMVLCWMGSKSTESFSHSAWVPQFSTASTKFSALFAPSTLQCIQGTPLGLDICCAWKHKLGCLLSENLHGQQATKHLVASSSSQRRKISKLKAYQKQTTGPQPTNISSLSSRNYKRPQLIFFSLSTWASLCLQSYSPSPVVRNCNSTLPLPCPAWTFRMHWCTQFPKVNTARHKSTPITQQNGEFNVPRWPIIILSREKNQQRNFRFKWHYRSNVLTDIYRIFHPTAEEYAFFSVAHYPK